VVSTANVGLCVGVALDVGAETLARRRAQGSGAILGEAQTLGGLRQTAACLGRK
jgi:hypothetical protein